MAEDEELTVYLHKASDGDTSPVNMDDYKTLVMPADTKFKKFLRLAGKKVGIKAVRCFLVDGTKFREVLAMDEVPFASHLVITSGRDLSVLSSQQDQETMFVSVLGTGGVGKSAITLRFVRDFFVRDWDPTIEDAYRKAVDVDGQLCMLDILDTAGQDEFESLRAQWMMDKDGYVLVYSMTSKQTLDGLLPFFTLHKQINDQRKNEKHVPIILVANKKDIVDANPDAREVSAEEGQELARKHNAVYVEASACSGENVSRIFETFVREVRSKKQTVDTQGGCGCVIA